MKNKIKHICPRCSGRLSINKPNARKKDALQYFFCSCDGCGKEGGIEMTKDGAIDAYLSQWDVGKIQIFT